ncbi:hypothetical protein D3C76_1751460 [compost metagenome]
MCVVAIVDRRSQSLDKFFSNSLTLCRSHVVDDVGAQIAQHHQAEVDWRFVLLQYGDQVIHQVIKLLVCVL